MRYAVLITSAAAKFIKLIFYRLPQIYTKFAYTSEIGWLRRTVAERQYFAGELSLFLRLT